MPTLGSQIMNRKEVINYLKLNKYDSVPIQTIANSDEPPKLMGESWHYETKGGTYIDHPSAYSNKGWSNMVYCPSTRHIVVGENWCGT